MKARKQSSQVVLYCEAAPLVDTVKGLGLSRALNPIVWSLSHLLRGTIIAPTSGVIRRNINFPPDNDLVLIPQFLLKSVKFLQLISSYFANVAMLLIFKATLPKKWRGIPIFAVIGADYKSILRANLAAKALRSNISFYFVDDISEVIDIESRKVDKIDRSSLNNALHNALPSFAISLALSHSIQARFGLNLQELCLPYSAKEMNFENSVAHNRIIYVGSVNYLYKSSLKLFIDIVDKSNREDGTNFELMLTISRDDAIREIGELPACVKFGDFPSHRALLNAIHVSNAALMPCSFEEQHRKMVESSFPSKLLDYLFAARKIVLLSPPYSSAARYLSEWTDVQPLQFPEEVIEAVRKKNDPDDRVSFLALLRRQHSEANFRHAVESHLGIKGSLE